MSLSSTRDIISKIQSGEMIVLTDEEDRENEGDLVIGAQFITPKIINFMATYGRGLICLTLTDAHSKKLGLHPMVPYNQSRHGTAFTTSIEAAQGISTGISAADRAHTILTAVSPGASKEDLVQPGHIFPVIAKNGGVLVRAGHTEAGCDLATLAGLTPATVICEIMNEDGTMSRLPDLLKFANKHNLSIGTISDLIQYRIENELLITQKQAQRIEYHGKSYLLTVFTDQPSGGTHLAISAGKIETNIETLVRVQEHATLLDFLTGTPSEHSVTLDASLSFISKHQPGVLLLLNCDEHPQSLLSLFSTENTTHQKKWDSRLYGIGAQILRQLGVRKMKLLSQFSPHMPNMSAFGLEVTGHLSTDSI